MHVSGAVGSLDAAVVSQLDLLCRLTDFSVTISSTVRPSAFFAAISASRSAASFFTATSSMASAEAEYSEFWATKSVSHARQRM